MTLRLTRRAALLGLAGAVSLGRSSLALAAAPTDRRLVVILLRGALDGLSAIPPYGDASLAALRPDLLLPQPGAEPGTKPGTQAALLDLGGFFGLHPALAGMHRLYQANQALLVHAVAGNWRIRSHFEAQDCMESGADHRLDSGWLNRVAGELRQRADHRAPGPQIHRPMGEAIAFSPGLPLLLRGPAQAGSWLPDLAQNPSPEFYRHIAELSHDDTLLGPAIAEGLRERGFADSVMSGSTPLRGYSFATLAAAAGKLLATADGPRLAALEITGWDTHSGQLPRLVAPLRALDAGLTALHDNLGPAWASTAVLVMTEFGRTVRSNGTTGTDHGTATVSFLLGGRVAGGNIRADWPGLKPAQLFENRDLAPTTDLRAVAKGVLAEHLGLPRPALERIFPNSRLAAPTSGLLHA